MTKTNELIDDLVRDLRPVRRGALGRRLAAFMLPGVVVSAALIVFVHGLRPDLGSAVSLPVFWIKSAYPALLAVIASGALLVVARPEGRPLGTLPALAVVYGLLVTLAVLQMRHVSSPAESRMLVMGVSAWYCPLIILATGAPLMVAAFRFLRKGAPTSPVLAGTIAGLTSGSIGAWIYSWGCIENGLPFVALWYTLGIVLSALIGGAIGRLWLRW